MTTSRQLHEPLGPPPSPWIARAGAVAIATLLLVAGFVFRTARTESADLREARTQAERHEILAIRGRLAWLHFDLLTDGLHAETQRSTLSEEQLSAFNTELGSALAELSDLARHGEAPTVAAAERLIEGYDEGPIDITDMPSAAELDDAHYHSLDSGLSFSEFEQGSEQLDVLYISMLPRLVLADALVVELSAQPDGPSEWAAEYFDYTYETLVEVPGWFGPDRNAPFADNVVADFTAPDVATVVHDAVGDQSTVMTLWDYDQWLIESSERGFDDARPLTIEELREATISVDRQLRPAALTALRTEQRRAANQADGTYVQLLTAISIAIALAAVTVAGVFVIRRSRRHRVLSDAVLSDPLTGARNRRFLDDGVAGLCRRRHVHHIIAMIDLDRFKIVNDTWGHDTGDAILVATVRRLSAVAKELVAEDERTVVEVMRHGGDEFVVSIHSPKRLDIRQIERRIRAIAGPVDVGLDDPVQLELSVGLAQSFEPADVHDLLKSADLATYEDKRSGANPIEPRPASGPKTSDLDLRR